MSKEKFAGEDQLKELLTREPDALTSLELEILKSRRSYLTDQELVKYGLNEAKHEESEQELPPEREAEVPTKAKKAKKSK